MKTPSNIVLAIYPNRRGFGYALLENKTEPIDCGIAIVRPLCNRQCLKRIIRFIDYYEPTLIILQEAGIYGRKGTRVQALIEQIVSVCDARELAVKRYTREQMRYVFEQFGARTKHEIAQALTRWLPQFKDKVPGVRKSWMCERYHMGMFDAIALAITYFYLEE